MTTPGDSSTTGTRASASIRPTVEDCRGRRGGERMTPNRDLMSTIHHSSVGRPLFGVTDQAPHDDPSQAASLVSRIPGEPTMLLVLLFDVSGPARLGAHLAHADSIVSTLRWTEPA